MLTLGSIMVGTMDLKTLARFWTEVLGEPSANDDGNWCGWEISGTYLMLSTHSEMKGETKDPGRIMLNLSTNKVKEEFERIKKIKGVKVIKEPYEMGGMWIATLADPDGNYFQLMPPWEEK